MWSPDFLQEWKGNLEEKEFLTNDSGTNGYSYANAPLDPPHTVYKN